MIDQVVITLVLKWWQVAVICFGCISVTVMVYVIVKLIYEFLFYPKRLNNK